MRAVMAEFEEIELPDKGHWIMADAKEEVTGVTPPVTIDFSWICSIQVTF